MPDRNPEPVEVSIPRSTSLSRPMIDAPKFEEPQRNPLQALWRHKWAMLTVLAICLGGGYYYLKKTPLSYTSRARVYVQQHSGGDGTVGAVNTADSYLYLQSELVKSNELLGVVASDPTVAKLDVINGTTDKIRFLRQGLEVEIDKVLSVLTISFTTTSSPDDAVLLVNAILDEYYNSHIDPSRESSNTSKVVNTIRQEKLKIDERLLAAQEAIQKFKSENPELAYVSEKGNVIVDTLTSLSQKLTQYQEEETKARASWEAALAVQNKPKELWNLIAADKEIDLTAVQRMKSLSEEINEMEFKVQELTALYGPNHMGVRSTKSRLEVCKVRYVELTKEATEEYLARLKQVLTQADKLEHDFRIDYDTQRTKAIELYEVQSRLKKLQQDYDSEWKNSTENDVKRKALETQQLEAVLNINVIQRGDGLAMEISPRPKKVLGMAGVMGLALGILCAYLIDITDRRVRSVDEIRFALKRPILGAVPHARGSHDVKMLGRQVDLYPQSDVAEAFRIIRTAIQVGLRSSKTRPIVVTSPFPGDGKTVTCSNLAITMAKAGKKTLLIDADLRSPSVHKVHSLENNVGLSSVLAGEADLVSATQWSGIPNLDILPAGSEAFNPAELLNSDKFRQILKECGTLYDAILVDAPPVLPVADATIISAACKGTLLVMRAGKCTLKQGFESIDRLTHAGANVLGVVVNDVRRGDGPDLVYEYSYPRNKSATRRALPTAAVARPAAVDNNAAETGEARPGDTAVITHDAKVISNNRGNSNGTHPHA